MGTHTIYDELTQLAKRLGVDVTDTHNIKDVLRRMNQKAGADSNARDIAGAVRRMKETLPYVPATPLSALSISGVTLAETFNPYLYSYHGTVTSPNTAVLTVTEDEATVYKATWNGVGVSSGATLTFAEGEANILVVTVIEDDKTPITYTITVPYKMYTETEIEEEGGS